MGSVGAPARIDRSLVDVHCHCLPGLDDGPSNMGESIALCRAMVADGVSRAVATSHQFGKYDGANSGARIRAAVTELNARLRIEQIPLSVLPGADVRIDERILDGVRAGSVLTLADRGAALLLELPHSSYIDPTQFIESLHADGVRVVLTHPERYRYLRPRLTQLARQWVEQGALLQITAGSLLGDFGEGAARISWQLLEAFPRHALLASDAHDATRRRPCLRLAIEAVGQRLGDRIARRAGFELPTLLIAPPEEWPQAERVGPRPRPGTPDPSPSGPPETRER